MSESVDQELTKLLGQRARQDANDETAALVLQTERADHEIECLEDEIDSLEAEVIELRKRAGDQAKMSEIRDPWLTQYFQERPQITAPHETIMGYEIPYPWKCVVESLLQRIRDEKR